MSANYREECPACVARRAEDARPVRWRVDPLGSTLTQWVVNALTACSALGAVLAWHEVATREPGANYLAASGLLCVLAVAMHVRRGT